MTYTWGGVHGVIESNIQIDLGKMTCRITTHPFSLSSLMLLLLLALISLENIISAAASSRAVTNLDRLSLPSDTIGPDTTAFDPSGGGPYCSVTPGKILKWSGPSVGFVDFAHTSQNRSNLVCSTAAYLLDPQCGRPTGIEFYNKTGTLYIADAYRGLLSVGPNGGEANQLATSADNQEFKLTDGMEVDQQTGVVYFTDASATYHLNEALVAIATLDRSGRLLKYDPSTKQVTVLLRGLGGPAGVALSKGGSFLLVTELISIRVQRYWLKGPKANTAETFFIPPGPPDNIRRNPDGNFWLAVAIVPVVGPVGLLLNEDAQVLQTLNFASSGLVEPISNIQEFDGKLYVGSLLTKYVGVTTAA